MDENFLKIGTRVKWRLHGDSEEIEGTIVERPSDANGDLTDVVAWILADDGFIGSPEPIYSDDTVEPLADGEA